MAEQRDFTAAIAILESLRAQGCDLPTAISKLQVAQRRAKPGDSGADASTAPQNAAPRPDPARQSNHDSIVGSLRSLGVLAAEDDARDVVKPKAAQRQHDRDIAASLKSMGVIGDEEDGE